MRILLVSHGFPPDSVGGVEQHVAGLAYALAAAGHDVHVYAKTGLAERPQGERLGPAGENPRITRVVYRYEGLDGMRSLYEVADLEHSFDEFLSEFAFDVAHVHHLTGMSTGLLDVLARRNIPSVLTLHDYWLMCPRGQMFRDDKTVCETVDPYRCADCLRPTFGGWIPDGDAGAEVTRDLHELARRTIFGANRIVVPSARAIPPFERLGVPAERIAVVENGVDVQALATLPAVEASADRPLRFGFLGTLIPSKGLDVLIEATRRIGVDAAEVHVHGNAVPYHGDESYLTRAFSRLDPRHCRVAYHGPYWTEELPKILAGIDVLVAPALWNEAFGLTVREAIAAGRPVVASRIGGLQDAFVDGREGLYTAPGDVEGLAEALRGLASDRSRVRELAAGCRARPAPRDFAAMAAELLGVYRGLTGLERPEAKA